MPQITEAQVVEQLRKVIDPELFVNIVDLGLIYLVDLSTLSADAAPDADAPAPTTQAETPTETPQAETPQAETPPAETPQAPAAEADSSAPAASAEPPVKVKIEMTMTSPMCPAGPQLVANSKQMVGQIPGVEEVEVKVVMDPPWTPDKMTDDAKDQLGIF